MRSQPARNVAVVQQEKGLLRARQIQERNIVRITLKIEIFISKLRFNIIRVERNGRFDSILKSFAVRFTRYQRTSYKKPRVLATSLTSQRACPCAYLDDHSLGPVF